MPPQLGGEEREQDLVDAGERSAQVLELVRVDCEGLGRFEGAHGRGAPRLRREERSLTEVVTDAAHRKCGGIAQGRDHPHRETALGDQVQAIGWVIAVKDDLAPCERAAASHGQQPLSLCLGDARQQAKPHRSIMALEHRRVSKPTDGMFPT